MFKFDQDPTNIKDFKAKRVTFCLPKAEGRPLYTV